MTDLFPPFLLFVAGAALLPFIPNGHPRALAAIIVPIISAYLIWMMPEGMHGQFTLVGQEITLLRVDKLSTIFGFVFSLAAFLALIYAWHVRDTIQQTMSLLYAGAAIGAVFAGDPRFAFHLLGRHRYCFSLSHLGETHRGGLLDGNALPHRSGRVRRYPIGGYSTPV